MPARQTIDWLNGFYRRTKVQPYYAFAPSAEAGRQMEAAKERLAAWLNVGEDEMQLGPSSSQNTFVRGAGVAAIPAPGRRSLSSPTRTTKRTSAPGTGLPRTASSCANGKSIPARADLQRRELEALLGPRTKVVAFTHCSNVVATINPVREWTDLIHRAGAWAFVDGVSFCPHGLPDVDALGADLYVFSLYKVYGPHLGAMVMRRHAQCGTAEPGALLQCRQPGARFTPAGPDHGQIATVNGLDGLSRCRGGPPRIRGPAGRRARGAAVSDLFREHETRAAGNRCSSSVATCPSRCAPDWPYQRGGSCAHRRVHQ